MMHIKYPMDIFTIFILTIFAMFYVTVIVVEANQLDLKTQSLCPTKCFCRVRIKGLMFVDCINKHYSSIPAKFPAKTYSLNMKGNFIIALRNGNLRDSSLGRLQKLNLSGNNIETIESGAFSLLSSLKLLDLSKNNLSTLSGDVFKSMKHLRLLNIKSNIGLDCQKVKQELKKFNCLVRVLCGYRSITARKEKYQAYTNLEHENYLSKVNVHHMVFRAVMVVTAAILMITGIIIYTKCGKYIPFKKMHGKIYTIL